MFRPGPPRQAEHDGGSVLFVCRTPSAGTPSKVYTDQELMAIINAVAQNRQLPGTAQDSQRLRSVASGGSMPSIETVTTPGDCVVFAAPESLHQVGGQKRKHGRRRDADRRDDGVGTDDDHHAHAPER